MEQIIAIVSDAASVMKALADLLDIEHQLCLAHGNHLGILSVVCKKKKTSDAFVEENIEDSLEVYEEEDESEGEEDVDEEESDSDEEVENEPEVKYFEGEEELDLDDAIKDLIECLRKAVNKINFSPVLSWQLQQEVKKWQRANDKKIRELVILIIVLAPTNQH